MKKIALAGLLLAAVGSASAQVYVGGGFGPSHVNIDCPAILGKCDTSDTGYKVYGGYKLNPSVALEVAYVDFGKAKFTGGSFASDGFLINAAFRHNFTRELNGVARLGVATLDTKLSANVLGRSRPHRRRQRPSLLPMSAHGRPKPIVKVCTGQEHGKPCCTCAMDEPRSPTTASCSACPSFLRNANLTPRWPSSTVRNRRKRCAASRPATSGCNAR